MASTRYEMNFGDANAGGAPAFEFFVRQDTGVAVAQPTIHEAAWAHGSYYFDWDWSTAPTGAQTISYKALLNGIEQWGVISANPIAGTVAASAATSSLSGYHQVGELVGRAAVRCGLLSLTRDQVVAYDPFASTDQSITQLLELLDLLGADLSSEVKQHLQREMTLTTAGGATSYALPDDYSEMVDDTLWNNSGIYPLSGPITPVEERFLHAWNGVTTVRIPFRVLGNRITFPIDPADGLLITGLYYSKNWIQTAASATGPDASRATGKTDYVLFDPSLVVLGLTFKWLQAKQQPSASIALAEYEKRLEWAKGVVGSARALSLNGRGNSGFRMVDNFNLPVTGWGLH